MFNLESSLNNLELFGLDSEKNNACCHKVEHKQNKNEHFNLDFKLKKSKSLKLH